MWEKIDKQTERLKVPGGWIVRSKFTEIFNGCAVSVHQIFVIDPDHSWSLGEHAEYVVGKRPDPRD